MFEVLRIFDPVTKKTQTFSDYSLLGHRIGRMEGSLRKLRHKESKNLIHMRGELEMNPVWTARNKEYEKMLGPWVEDIPFEVVVNAEDTDDVGPCLYSLLTNDTKVLTLLQGYAKKLRLDHVSIDDLIILGAALSFEEGQEPEYWHRRKPYTAILVPEVPPCILVEWESRLDQAEWLVLYKLWDEWYRGSQYRQIEQEPITRISFWMEWREKAGIDLDVLELPKTLAGISLPVAFTYSGSHLVEIISEAERKLDPEYVKLRDTLPSEWKMEIKRLYNQQGKYCRMVDEMLYRVLDAFCDVLEDNKEFKAKRDNILRETEESIRRHLADCNRLLREQHAFGGTISEAGRVWRKSASIVVDKCLSSQHFMLQVQSDEELRKQLFSLQKLDAELTEYVSARRSAITDLERLEKELLFLYLLRKELGVAKTKTIFIQRLNRREEIVSAYVGHLMTHLAQIYLIRKDSPNVDILAETYELDFTDSNDRGERSQVMYQKVSGTTESLRNHIKNARRPKVPLMSDDYLWAKHGPEGPSFDEEPSMYAGFPREFLHRVFYLQMPES